jgi:hypothetical protein
MLQKFFKALVKISASFMPDDRSMAGKYKNSRIPIFTRMTIFSIAHKKD